MTMPARIEHVTLQCRQPSTLADFWSHVLGFVEVADRQAGENVVIVDPQARHPGLRFVAVAESTRSGVRLDLMPERARDVTIDELLALGATVVDDRRGSDGSGTVVLADPEGNEFTVEPSPAERGLDAAVDRAEQEFPPGIHTASEPEMLAGMLDWYRAAVVRKVEGISHATARTSPVRSGTTIAGLLKHLALVEDSWFDDRFAGSPEPEPWASAPWDDDRDWEFHSAVEDPMEELVALYETSCDRSRRVPPPATIWTIER